MLAKGVLAIGRWPIAFALFRPFLHFWGVLANRRGEGYREATQIPQPTLQTILLACYV